jgi:hypothetical protein
MSTMFRAGERLSYLLMDLPYFESWAVTPDRRYFACAIGMRDWVDSTIPD